MTAEGIEASGVRAGYGQMMVLHDVSLTVPSGRALGVVGPNGAGKTTLLKALAGVLPLVEGRIVVGHEDVTRSPAHRRVARGVALVPEGRQVLGTLTVQANLDVTMFARGRMRPDEEHAARLDKVFELFPFLKDRRQQMGRSLSGGEQQMLAFGRALMTDPKILLVDEPSQGLAPRIVDQVGEILLHLKGDITLVIVEQHRRLLERIVDDMMELRLGRIATKEHRGRSE